MSATVNKNEIIRDEDIQVEVDDYSDNFHSNFNETEEDYVFLYVDYGNLSNDVDYSILPRQKGKVIEAILIEWDNWFERSELKAMNVDTIYEHFTNACNSISEFMEYCKRYNIKTVRDSYVEFYISGYSQGDGRTVIINRAEAEECWGNTVEGGVSQDSLFQMFCDHTNNVRLTILGTEFISEQDNQYDYDKDDLITELKEYFKDEIEDLGFFEEQLEDLLPTEL